MVRVMARFKSQRIIYSYSCRQEIHGIGCRQVIRDVNLRSLERQLYAFYEKNEEKCRINTTKFVKRIQDDVQDDVMRDAKSSQVSLTFH